MPAKRDGSTGNYLRRTGLRPAVSSSGGGASTDGKPTFAMTHQGDGVAPDTGRSRDCNRVSRLDPLPTFAREFYTRPPVKLLGLVSGAKSLKCAKRALPVRR